MLTSLKQRAMVGLVTALTAVTGWAADDASTSEPQSDASRQWTARRLAEMKEYRISIDLNGETVTPELIEQPLLNWSNPLRKAVHGALFVWTVGGRPQFVCCTFPSQNQIAHEMQSLADGRITRSHPERGEWQFDPPPAFAPLPDAPRPAASRSLRLFQMRKLASRFTAQVTHPELMEVRLLSQPVYRYPEEAEVDGAMFAFVQGTDPECLLVMEPTDSGWVFRVVRMTTVRLIVHLDGQLLREFTPTWEQPDRSYRDFNIDVERVTDRG